MIPTARVPIGAYILLKLDQKIDISSIKEATNEINIIPAKPPSIIN